MLGAYTVGAGSLSWRHRSMAPITRAMIPGYSCLESDVDVFRRTVSMRQPESSFSTSTGDCRHRSGLPARSFESCLVINGAKRYRIQILASTRAVKRDRCEQQCRLCGAGSHLPSRCHSDGALGRLYSDAVLSLKAVWTALDSCMRSSWQRRPAFSSVIPSSSAICEFHLLGYMGALPAAIVQSYCHGRHSVCFLPDSQL